MFKVCGIVIFIGALGFVGVGVDAIHQFTNGTVRGMFALIEEGGELFVMTGLLSFLILVYGHQTGSPEATHRPRREPEDRDGIKQGRSRPATRPLGYTP